MAKEKKKDIPKEDMLELNIYQKISGVMNDVKYVHKDREIKSGEKLLYRVTSHDTVIRTIRPFLIKWGIVVVPSILEHSQDGNRTTATVQVSFVSKDDPSDKVCVQYFGYGIDTSDKGPGKCISYAVRYALLKVFSLETGDDPENDDIEHKKDPISEAELINLREIAESYDLPADETLQRMAEKVFQLKKIDDLPSDMFETAKETLIKKGEGEKTSRGD